MKKRVVITGLGVVAPNGVGIENFHNALLDGNSAIQFIPELKDLNFRCQIGAVPDLDNGSYNEVIDQHGLSPASATVKYACTAGLEAWEDAGFDIPDFEINETDEETGIIIGSGIGSSDMWGEKIVPYTDQKITKRLKSTIIEHSMFSGPAANLAKILALGNQITSNSSACATGAEAILMGYERIQSGKSKRMLTGGTEIYSPYGWSGFDAMRVTTHDFNDNPSIGSRPMSASASGFVPGAGASVLLLEELDSAMERNARIYVELCGGFINSGGQRNGGTMTAPNPIGVQKCIQGALNATDTRPEDIDYISGHLSSTMADVIEINNWAEVLGRKGEDFPYINSLKSMIGHCIGAAGAIETTAAVLQIYRNFIHPSINCEDIHPEITEIIAEHSIPQKAITNIDVKCVAKASFGFGDVNACLILKSFE